jgi:membrane-associated protein
LSLGASVPSGLSAVALYVVIGSLVFAEDALFVGFLLPGETAVLAGGVLASQAKLSLPAVLGLVIIAAIAGDLVGYQVGEHWGTKLIGSRRLHRYRKRLDDARELVRTRGGWAVFAGRWVAFLRATVPPICGLSHMPMRSFVPWNAFGALSWGTVYTLIGYFGGASFEALADSFGHIVALAVLLAVLAAVGLALQRRRRHRKQPSGHPR